MTEYSINIFNVIILLGSVQGVWVSFLLFRSKSFRNKSNLFGALLVFSFSTSVFHQLVIDFGPGKVHPALFFMPLNWGLLIPFSLYFFIVSLTRNRQINRIAFYGALTPFALHFLFQLACFGLAVVRHPLLFNNIHTVMFILRLIEVFSIFFSLVILYISFRRIYKHEIILKNNYSSITNKSLHWLNRLLYILACLWALWSFPFVVELVSGSFAPWHHYPLWIGMSAVIYWIGYTIYIKREQFQEAPFVTDEVEFAPQALRSADEYFLMASEIMKSRQLYLNQNLTLKGLANEIDISAGYLSLIFNQKGTTFYDFVNQYRVEKVKELIAHNEFKHYSLLAIAMESGFNSKSTFNTAFKKHTGITPSRYRDLVPASPR